MAPRAEVASPSHLVKPMVELALGLPTEVGDDTPVTPKMLGALFEALALALDEEHLGLLLPDALKFTRYGLPEPEARSSPTLREALQRLSCYAPLLADSVALSFEETDGLARFSQQVPGHPRGVSRHLNEFAMAMGVHECRARTGRPMTVREVCFVHLRPRGSLEVLSAYFGTRALHFGHLQNTLVFDAAALDAPQLTSDPRLLQTAEALAEDALRRRTSSGTGFRAVVERSVREHLERSEFSIRTVALGLRMSPRTLQRRLEDEGTGFAEVLDGVRESLARELVSRPGPSLSEIAFQLGFAEFATFSRAFKRWTGSPSGAFRHGQG